jgi:hypothetical protein
MSVADECDGRPERWGTEIWKNPDRAIWVDLLRQADLPRQVSPPRRTGAENSRAEVVEQVFAVRGPESHERELVRVVRQLEVVAEYVRVT